MAGHNVRSWIRKRLIAANYDVDKLHELYDTFKIETGSEATRKSFIDAVSKERRRMIRNPEKFTETGELQSESFVAPESPTMKYTPTDGTTVEGQTEELKDADKLLEEWGIDTSKWAVETWDIKKQTIYAKDKRGSLEYGDGRIQEGSISYNGLVTYPVYHIRMRLIRKEIPKDIPTLHSVQISVGKPISDDVRWKKKDKNKHYKTAFIINDAQMGFERDSQTGRLDPFHDRAALDIAIQVAERVQPDMVIVNGDMLDLTEWSTKFVTGPEFVGTTQPALNELAWWLARLRKAVRNPNTEFHYIAGNHEDRLPKFISTYQKSLLGIRNVNGLDSLPHMSIPQLLSLDTLGYEWHGDYPHGRIWLNDYICVSHSEKDRTNTQTMTNQAAVLNIVAHIHRLTYNIKTLYFKDHVRYAGVVSFGSLCRLHDRVPAKGSMQDWQQGVGIVRYSEDNPDRFPPVIEPVPIHYGRTIFQGEELIGDDRKEELARDINWTGYL